MTDTVKVDQTGVDNIKKPVEVKDVNAVLLKAILEVLERIEFRLKALTE